ncbi:hypothetical protein KEM56_000791 [Ascosphaera pollenicola]|nr:hypothetical protein KEM56_000791 [Ascosphaera pollenicola]
MLKGDLEYEPKGIHGYDHEDPLMRAIFVARGPKFGGVWYSSEGETKRENATSMSPTMCGRKIDPFQNIQVYNMIADSLEIEPHPNNGSLRLPLKITGRHDLYDDGNTSDIESEPSKLTDSTMKTLPSLTPTPEPSLASTIKPSLVSTALSTSTTGTLTTVAPTTTTVSEHPDEENDNHESEEDRGFFGSLWHGFLDKVDATKHWAEHIFDHDGDGSKMGNRSRSSTPSVIMTSHTSLPDRPQEKDGILVREEIPSATSVDEVDIRTFSIPKIKRFHPLHGAQPVRALDWKKVWEGIAPVMKIEPYNAEKRNSMVLQSRGEKKEGECACRPCKSGRGPFRSCVVDPTSDKIGLGACANCIWAKKTSECNLRSSTCLEAQDNPDSSSEYVASGDDIPARTPATLARSATNLTRLSRRQPREGSRLGLGVSKRNPPPKKSKNVLQQFMNGSLHDREPTSSPPPQSLNDNHVCESLDDTHELRRADPARCVSPESAGSLGSCCADASKQSTDGHKLSANTRNSRYSQPKIDNRECNPLPVTQQSAIAAADIPHEGHHQASHCEITSGTIVSQLHSQRTHPEPFSSLHRQNGYSQQQLVTPDLPPHTAKADIENGMHSGNVHHEQNFYEADTNGAGVNPRQEAQGSRKSDTTGFFKIPANLSSKSIPDIELAIQELDQLKSKLGKRKRLLEAAERDTFD